MYNNKNYILKRLRNNAKYDDCELENSLKEGGLETFNGFVNLLEINGEKCVKVENDEGQSFNLIIRHSYDLKSDEFNYYAEVSSIHDGTLLFTFVNFERLINKLFHPFETYYKPLENEVKNPYGKTFIYTISDFVTRVQSADNDKIKEEVFLPIKMEVIK